jgi:glycosyltransferase involved in cell wall biosynthesis
MSKPFISICIPTYKRTHLLKKLLDSIYIQTFRNFEIMINDNSPDDSVEILLDAYKTELPISYEKNQPAISAGANCIKVIRRAGGDWVKVMHDDDWFDSNDALQHFADTAINSGKDFIFCASNQVWLDKNKREQELLSSRKKLMLDDSNFSLFYLNLIGHPSVVMFKRDNAIEFDAAFNWVQDVDFYMRYLNAHPGYAYIPKTLVNIGKGSLQESNKYYKNINKELPEYFTLLSKYDQNLSSRNKYVFHLIWNMIKRYNIKSIDKIHEAGYKGPMPDTLNEIITYQKKIPRIILRQTPWSEILMNRCFKRHKKLNA